MSEASVRATEAVFPASYGQRRLWILDQFEPASAAYNVPLAIRITGPLDLDVVERSLSAIVARHEALRTRFELRDGEPVQLIDRARLIRLERLDLTDAPEAGRERQAQELLSEASLLPFDLAHGPLLRAVAVRLAPADHIVLLTLHHIVCDGWSLSVLLRELSIFYNAVVAGRPPVLPALEIQYADYSEWLREWLDGGELQKQLPYWQRQLNGVPVLQLQTDRPRPTAWTSRGARLPVHLPPTLASSLSALALQERTTLFMLLLAAFQTLLRRYSGQEDIAVGSPIAGRNRVELEPLIGFFVNTLVLRTDLNGDPTFRELLARVREVTLAALSRQDLPFEKLVEELRPERATTRTPFFQTMFTLHNTAPAVLEIDGTTAVPYELAASTAKFEISLALRPTSGGLTGTLEYNSDLFDRSTIARMTAHFRRLLESICANPDTRLSLLPMLTGEEHQQLARWKGTQVNSPARCLHQLFEAQVERTPDVPAVIIGTETATYAELNARANHLALRLREGGIHSRDIVGVCLERSIHLVSAEIAVAKAGGAFLAMEPRDPVARLRGMVEDSGARVIVASAANVDRLRHEIPDAIVVDCDQPISARRSASNLEPVASVDDLFYVMFTSGSTGRPKGVMISHRAFFNYLHAQSERFPLTAADRVLQRSPVGFDVSVWEMLAPLAVGGAIVLPPRSPSQFDPSECVSTIVKHGVTIVQMVPPLLELLLDEPAVGRCGTLRRVFCGGAPLTLELQARFFQRLPHAELVNLYGPTEACVYATAWICMPGERGETVPIGRPFDNTELYVLGPQLELLPIGASGELAIGGVSLARGYINRPDLTAEQFIAHPFSREPRARLYRTGDRVRYLPDGNLEFLGRLDDQVKIRGVRVELSEVEAALGAHPQVQQAAVIAPRSATGERELVAYYVAGEPEPPITELRHFLHQLLPDSMVPGTFMGLEALPLTASGKIDRQSLPAPIVARGDSGDGFVAPRGPIETSIADVWREALHVDRVGVHDDFFELGGHSLLAVQVIAKIRARHGLDLPLRALFEAPTIAQLSLRVGSERLDHQSCLVPLHAGGSKTPFFCLHALGGEVRAYGELARLLDPDRPFFGVRALTVEHEKQPTIQAMAARYIAEIRLAFPKGPYLLGGYSAGAALAYEMAQQLTASGERVPLVVALDSRLPNAMPSGQRSARLWLDGARNLFWWLIDDLSEAKAHEIAARLRSKAAIQARRVAHLPGLGWLGAYTQIDIRDHLGIPWYPKELAVSMESLFASHNAYRPGPYPGKVALFRARTRPLFRLWEPDLGWSRMAKGGVEVHIVPGSHSNLLRWPHVQALATALRQSLDATETARD